MKIKFRAWNKKEKIMYLSPNEMEHLGSWFDAHLPGSLAEKENIELMQYAGLNDKNGKEIYTGDTLLDDEDFYIVEFDEGCFVAILDGNIVFPLSEIAGDCEIIGNIYDKMESQDED